jgi:hypothetical protein
MRCVASKPKGNYIAGLLGHLPAWVTHLLGQGGIRETVFFVLSGLLIPRTVARSRVTVSVVERFMLRRSLQLEPPHWFAIGHLLCAARAAGQGVAVVLGRPDRRIHLPSAGNTGLSRYPEINFVFWTLCQESADTLPAPGCVRADIARPPVTKTVFVKIVIHPTAALETARAVLRPYRTRICQSAILSPLRSPCANQAAEKAKKPRHDLVEVRELTKHTRRIPGCHTSRRDVSGDDAACTNYGPAADADAGKDDRL